MDTDNITKSEDTSKINFFKKMVSKEMILLFFYLVFSLLAMFFLVIPKYENMKILEMETKLTKDSLASKKDMLDKIANFKEANKNVRDKDLDKIYNLLPDKNNYEEHMANIYNLAKDSGVLISSIAVSEEKDSKSDRSSELEEADGSWDVDKKFNKVNINFLVSGDFSSFIKFLDSLEKSIPLINLSKLEIVKDSGKDKNGGFEYDIESSFYYLSAN